MSRQEPKNTLQQDLMLLAKNHYHNGEMSKIDMAKRICAFHILADWSYFKSQDVCFWLLKEFFDAGLILETKEKITRFIMEHGKWAPKDQAYYDTVIEDLLSQIAHTQARKDGVWCLPFPEPQIDPYIVELLKPAVEA